MITRQRSFTGDKILPCGEQIIGPYLTLLQSKGYLFAWISAMELEPVRNDLLKSGYTPIRAWFQPISNLHNICLVSIKGQAKNLPEDKLVGNQNSLLGWIEKTILTETYLNIYGTVSCMRRNWITIGPDLPQAFSKASGGDLL